MTLFGWDASDYDSGRGPMNMVAAQQAGISFFSHKATEQDTDTVYKHSKYGPVMGRARDAGIPYLAAYCVPRSGVKVSTQIDTFLSYVDQQTPWWRTFRGFFFQTDLEKWPYDAVQDETGEEMVRQLRVETQKTVFLYASKGQYGSTIDGDMLKWNANYAPENAPTREFKAVYGAVGGDSGPGWEPYSGSAPLIWQYASDTSIGTQPTCDANAFRGTLLDFDHLIVPALPADPVPPEASAYNAAFNAGYNAAFNKAFQVGYTAGRR